MEKRILVVDDERNIRQLLRECLEMEGYQVATAASGAEAAGCLSPQPDLILLDVNMPDMDGYLLCERIRDYVSCPILFLTARAEEQDRVSGFRSGGDDYVVKPFGIDELLARIEAHLRREDRRSPRAEEDPGRETAGGKLWVTGCMKPGMGLVVDKAGRNVLWGDNSLGLTKTEYNIVELLLEHRGQVLTKEQIYERVRGYDGCGDSNIITEHIRRIRKKLEHFSAEEYIVTVWGVGYKWNG